LPDDALLEIVQRQTFRYFWEGAHPVSGLAFDRRTSRKRSKDTDAITIGGSGFGVMALLVAAERGWVSRAAALERLARMLDVLARARCYHGAFPHFMDGGTGKAIPFGRKDDGGDLVETSLLMMACSPRANTSIDSRPRKRRRAHASRTCGTTSSGVGSRRAGVTFSIGTGARTTVGR